MTVDIILGGKGEDVITISPETSVADTAKLLSEKRIGAVVVCDSAGGIKGIVSERDIVRGICQHGVGVMDKAVEAIMTAQVHTCTGSHSVIEVMEMMTGRRIRHIPVVEDGRLRGIISIGDVVKKRIADAEQEAQALRDYITT